MIIFEEFSFLRFLAVLPAVRAAGEFYVLDRRGTSDALPDVDGILRRCRWLVPGLKVHALDPWACLRDFFRANTEYPHQAEALDRRIRESAGYQLIHRLYPDPGVAVAFKKAISDELAGPAIFLQTLRRLKRTTGRIVTIPARSDVFGLFSESGVTIPLAVRIINGTGEALRALSLPALWLGTIAYKAWSGQATPRPLETPYAMQVVWGALDDMQPAVQGGQKSRRNRWNSFYLEDGDEFSPKRILYCFHHWHFSQDNQAKIRDFINGRGGQSCVISALRPSWRHILLRQLHQFGARSADYIVAGLLRGPAEWRFLRAAIRILHNLNIWEVFCLHYRPRVMMSHDDQSLSHAARTIVFSRHGLRNAGIHHPAESGLHISPVLAYVHYHFLFRYGPLESRLFAPFWDTTPGAHVGPYRADLIRAAELDHHRREAFLARYGGRKTLLVAAPGDGLCNDPDRLHDFYLGLSDLAEKRPDLLLIIRPRIRFKLNARCKPVVDSLIERQRAVIEMDNFDTYELIAYCDGVISPPSSMLQEALAAGRPAFCFSFQHLDEMYSFHELNPKLVVTTRADLVERGLALLEGEDPLDNIDQVRFELAAEAYGSSIPRIRNHLRALAHPV